MWLCDLTALVICQIATRIALHCAVSEKFKPTTPPQKLKIIFCSAVWCGRFTRFGAVFLSPLNYVPCLRMVYVHCTGALNTSAVHYFVMKKFSILYITNLEQGLDLNQKLSTHVYKDIDLRQVLSKRKYAFHLIHKASYLKRKEIKKHTMKQKNKKISHVTARSYHYCLLDTVYARLIVHIHIIKINISDTLL